MTRTQESSDRTDASLADWGRFTHIGIHCRASAIRQRLVHCHFQDRAEQFKKVDSSRRMAEPVRGIGLLPPPLFPLPLDIPLSEEKLNHHSVGFFRHSWLPVKFNIESCIWFGCGL
jgi:hypothetical protein